MKLRRVSGLAILPIFSVLSLFAPGAATRTSGAPASTQPAPGEHRPSLSPEERGDIYMARKQYADAIDYYLRALRDSRASNQASSRLWNKMGIAYQQQGDFRAAREAYKRAIRDDKTFPAPWNNLGTTYFLADKFRKSTKFYRRALALEPSSASFHMNLGTAYYRMKKYPSAVEEYRQALMLDPNILREHSETGSVVEARSADREYFYYLAKVFASLGRPDDAVRYLRRAFEDGFKNFKRLDEDPDFLKISKNPSYIALRQNPPVPIKD